MYSAKHLHNVKVERAWQEYIDALEDVTVPYSRVVELRTAYEELLEA